MSLALCAQYASDNSCFDKYTNSDKSFEAMTRRQRDHVRGSRTFSHVVEKLLRSGSCCRSGLRNVFAIVTTVNPSRLQLLSSIKERVTNFSKPPFKPTGTENEKRSQFQNRQLLWDLKSLERSSPAFNSQMSKH